MASDDDQIDSNIIFDDPYVENNGGTSEHDSNDHDEYHNIQILAYNGIRSISPNGVFGNEVYGGDLKGFGVNPSSDEFMLCSSNEWRSINGGGPLGIRGYGGGGDMIRDGLKGCLDHRILRSLPILPPL
ncbi:hypothetical protein Tco_1360025 [Tanacetum coccineum]